MTHTNENGVQERTKDGLTNIRLARYLTYNVTLTTDSIICIGWADFAMQPPLFRTNNFDAREGLTISVPCVRLFRAVVNFHVFFGVRHLVNIAIP